MSNLHLNTSECSPQGGGNLKSVRVKGKDTTVPSVVVGERVIVMTGRLLKQAEVRDEFFVKGDIMPYPQLAINVLKNWNQRPDIFSFAQKITEPVPRFQLYYEWKDFAVIKITNYEDWLKNKAKKDARENLRRAQREGVVVRAVDYDDNLVAGIKELYDETPLRQGKRFWHYGKTLQEIDNLHGTYKDRAEFIGAYLGSELIGFIKMVYVDNIAKTMHVISKERHFQKRPTNLLIAKAVEICVQKGVEYFNYGEFNFPGKRTSSLTEFKRRNGFEEYRFPRYYVPLTMIGSVAIKTKLHHGLVSIVPSIVREKLTKMRAVYYKRKVKT